MSSSLNSDLLNWNQGPDALIPSESYTTCELSKAVKLRLGENDSKLYPPISIYTMFKNTV